MLKNKHSLEVYLDCLFDSDDESLNNTITLYSKKKMVGTIDRFFPSSLRVWEISTLRNGREESMICRTFEDVLISLEVLKVDEVRFGYDPL